MIQIVCVKWGTKYGADPVNRLLRAIARHTGTPFRFVCITDQPAGDYDPRVILKPFPAFSAPFETLKRACRLKLAIFAPGLLDPDLPTIYIDLDTMIRGDVQRIADELQRHPGVYMLQNHFIQWWPLGRYVRLVAPERYYFGNSSVLAFVPAKYGFIYEEFNRRMASPPEPLPKYLKSDERFISYIARDTVRVFPRRLAVKFAEEYMAPAAFLEEVRKRLPWVAARRRAFVAVTFVGNDFKPERLAALKKGDVVHYGKLTQRWDNDDFRDYWRGPA
jgi:hypothetical protein